MWKANGRTTDAYPWQKLTWPMARWAKKCSELKWTTEKTLCEKHFFLPRQNRQFRCNASFFFYIIRHWKKMFLAVIVITNSYLNNSWTNWIGIIFHLFTTVCKYGVSTLQYTLQNMVEIPSKFQMDF